jgi:hypothetical protein
MSIDLGAMTSPCGDRESRLPLMSPCSRARLGNRTPRRPAFRADRRHVVALESGRDHGGETAPKSVAAMVPTAPRELVHGERESFIGGTGGSLAGGDW